MGRLRTVLSFWSSFPESVCVSFFVSFSPQSVGEFQAASVESSSLRVGLAGGRCTRVRVTCLTYCICRLFCYCFLLLLKYKHADTRTLAHAHERKHMNTCGRTLHTNACRNTCAYMHEHKENTSTDHQPTFLSCHGHATL